MGEMGSPHMGKRVLGISGGFLGGGCFRFALDDELHHLEGWQRRRRWLGRRWLGGRHPSLEGVAARCVLIQLQLELLQELL